MRSVVSRACTVLALSLLPACAAMAVATAPSKPLQPANTAPAAAADAAFWSALHGGRYDDIGPVLEGLTREYLEHPGDPHLAAHVAFLHVWRLGERARLERPRATVTDDITLARRYFEEASKLAPDDPRFRGFLASVTMAEGSIHHEEAIVRRGYFEMEEAVSAWPEFNLFTRGYVLSSQPAGSERFRRAVDDQWRTFEVCFDAHVDREHPELAPFMKLETTEGWKRACWNSWIAPHNLEGFFLNMGDMIVKDGKAEVARRVYAQARLSRTYATWPYRDVLERRITQADANVERFGAPDAPKDGDPERRIMFETPFACMGCHQASGEASRRAPVAD